MKKLFGGLLVLLLVIGCSNDSSESAKDKTEATEEEETEDVNARSDESASEAEEQEDVYRELPMPLDEFIATYNLVLESFPDIAEEMDLENQADDSIETDDKVNIKLNEDGTMAQVAYTGEPDTMKSSFILAVLGISDNAEADKLVNDLYEAATVKNENYAEELHVNNMTVKAMHENGTYELLILGEEK